MYEQLGGHPFFERLVDDFYERVGADPSLRPMYPEEDLSGAKERLRLFVEQYWGGPTTYSEQRGHPRLRMRHAPYPVGLDARNAWMGHMTAAVTSADLPAELEQELLAYFDHAATHMINTVP